MTGLHGRSEKMQARNMENAPYDSLGKSGRLLAAIYICTAPAYLVWRFGILNPEAPVFSWLVYGAEIYGIIMLFLLLFTCWRFTRPVVTPPPDDLTIDVLVPSSDEPVEVVRRTLLASTRMEYPHQTWLLDAGNRPAMQALAERLGCRYLARSGNADGKAGTLNNALRHSNADFLAVFDAGHAPHRHFLTRTLGYFRNAEVAFVQTPKHYYNLDSCQSRAGGKTTGLWADQALFVSAIQRGRDYWNSALFCGSSGILRRSCLDAIGGFATGTITEDLHTSLRLHERGYASVYHPEALAFGIAALDPGIFLRQQLRRGQGAMQVWRKEKVLSNRKLRLPQRLNYFAKITACFGGWQRAIFYITPAIVLLFGTLPISTTVSRFLVFFVPYLVISLWTFKVITRGYGSWFRGERSNFARFAVFCQSTFALFRPRPGCNSPGETRNKPSAPVTRGLLPHMAVVGLAMLAIPSGVYLSIQTAHLPLDAVLAGVVWSGLLIGVASSLFKTLFLNTPQRRQEYRFRIPVCASISLEGQLERLVTVTDLSPTGIGFYGKLPGRAEAGRRLTGHLYLPGGRMPFSAFIRSLRACDANADSVLETVHCEFGLQSEDVTEQLEEFLYGSDLPCHMQSESHPTRTPLSPPGRSERPAAIPAIPAARHWSCCTYLWPVHFDLKRFYGVISACGITRSDARHLIATQPLSQAGTILVRPETYGNESVISASLVSETQLHTANGPLYLYELDDCRKTSTWLDDAIPA